MLAGLILGFSSLVAEASAASPASTVPARSTEVRRARRQADVPTRSWFDAPVKDAESKSKTVCAIKVLRADPSIDRGIVKAVERPVDPGMVAPSICAK
jgi:hypothetical protein